MQRRDSRRWTHRHRPLRHAGRRTHPDARERHGNRDSQRHRATFPWSIWAIPLSGDTVSNVEIDNLPLVNRNVYRLLQLVPGVQTVRHHQQSGLSGDQGSALMVRPTASSGQVSYYLDGGLNMTGLRNSGNQIPNPDAVSQFNVVTNNFSAQLGRYSAAVVSIVTKSGTNSSMARCSSSTATETSMPPRTMPARTHRRLHTICTGSEPPSAVPSVTIRTSSSAASAGYRYSEPPPLTAAIFRAPLRLREISPKTFRPTSLRATRARTAADNTNFKFLVCNPATHQPYPGQQHFLRLILRRSTF